MFKKSYIMLTGAQKEEFKKTGKTTHPEGGCVFHITSNDKGLPVVERVEIIPQDFKGDYPRVDFPDMFPYISRGLPLYVGE